MTSDSETIDTVARTAWGEARGCGARGMQRVINVIVNRATHPRWWGHSLEEVCLEAYQFSCRNANDPNRAKLLAVTVADVDFALALGLAKQAVAATLQDLTNGADSYFATSMRSPPYWVRRATLTASDGWHSFYRVELPSLTGTADAPTVSVHAGG